MPTTEPANEAKTSVTTTPFIGVPLMSLFVVPIHRAVATAAGWVVVIALPSVLVLLFTEVADAPPYTLGAVNLPAFITIIAMTLLTTPLGVRLAHSMDARPLKRIFAIFLAIVALNMLRNKELTNPWKKHDNIPL